MTHDSISPFLVEKITKKFGKEEEEEPNSNYQIN
jgi:hypothetical protein